MEVSHTDRQTFRHIHRQDIPIIKSPRRTLIMYHIFQIVLISNTNNLSIRFIFILLFMVATTALSQKYFNLYPRIPERLELFPGLTYARTLETHLQRWVGPTQKLIPKCYSKKLNGAYNFYFQNFIFMEDIVKIINRLVTPGLIYVSRKCSIEVK